MQDIHCLSDWSSFLDSLLLWIPSERLWPHLKLALNFASRNKLYHAVAGDLPTNSSLGILNRGTDQ